MKPSPGPVVTFPRGSEGAAHYKSMGQEGTAMVDQQGQYYGRMAVIQLQHQIITDSSMTGW